MSSWGDIFALTQCLPGIQSLFQARCCGYSGAWRAPAARCCPCLQIGKHNELENMLLNYVACPDIGAWVILSTSRYLFSFEMIKVLCSFSPEMLAANCWFCFINYCHWSSTSVEPRSVVMHCRASCLSEPQPVVQGLCLKTKINKQTNIWFGEVDYGGKGWLEGHMIGLH